MSNRWEIEFEYLIMLVFTKFPDSCALEDEVAPSIFVKTCNKLTKSARDHKIVLV